MKKTTIVCTVALLCLFVAGATQADEWSGAATIRDEAFYVASTGLTLGNWTTVLSAYPDYAMSGYTITNDFQLNLEYQDGILDADIANLNTYLYPANPAFPPGHANGTWSLNYSDNEDYVFNISLIGGLTIYEFDGLAETVGGSDIKWTITGWHQTILAGDIIGNELVVIPTGTYRPFISDPPVNSVETFTGDVACEVLGYTFTGAAGGIGSGSALGVHLVPEPATISILAIGAMALLRKRK